MTVGGTQKSKKSMKLVTENNSFECEPDTMLAHAMTTQASLMYSLIMQIDMFSENVPVIYRRDVPGPKRVPETI